MNNFKHMESLAIDYITKLAFKSSNSDVSLAAIQFLNSHYTQPDTITSAKHQSAFVTNCMKYLNEAYNSLSSNNSNNEQILDTIAHGCLLLKNHLDLFQKRLCQQLRSMQLDEALDSDDASCGPPSSLISHAKLLQQVDAGNGRDGNLITLNCHINSTQFKFGLYVSLADCLGDLKALIRQIVLRSIKG